MLISLQVTAYVSVPRLNHFNPKEHQHALALVADELATAAGENGRTPDQARPILPAAAGGESPHAAAVWGHAAKDCGAPITSRIGEPWTETDFGAERDWRRKSV